jgi:hypothetical protein
MKNNNLSPLPFYRNINEQHHRKTYAYGATYPLYCPLGSMPPFQCIIPHGSVTLTAVTLINFNTGTGTDITAEMQETGLQIVRFAAFNYDVIVYPATAPMNISNKEGRYYLMLTLSDNTYLYSDVFTLIADTSGYVLVQWWDNEDFVMDGCRIVYRRGYRNTLWLQTQLGKPDYEFSEEGETRDGYFFPEKMISEKRYKCSILAPEYLCDVMRFIRLSDFVDVLDQYGTMYHCDTFLCTPEWQEQGDLASVEIEFTCDTVAKKVGRYITAGQPAFNNDYNNDYDN